MNLLKKVVLLFLFFSYIYSIAFAPLKFSFQIILGVLGVILYILNFKTEKKLNFLLQKHLPILLLLLFVTMCSIALNGTSDYYYFKWVILSVFQLFGAYSIMKIFQFFKEDYSFENITHYFVISGLLQCIISLAMYFSPSFMVSSLSLLATSDALMDSVDRTFGTRLIGFGPSFFGVAVIQGFVLIILSIYMANSKMTYFKTVVLSLAFVIITTVSMMLARTSMVGAFIGLFIIMIGKGKSVLYIISRFFKTMFIGGIVMSIILFALSRLSSEVKEMLEIVYNFAFEIFINYFESDSLSTSSSDNTLGMWSTIPKNLSTWIFGDGLWNTPDGRYYMGTDVGFLRNIFYIGLIGSFVYYYYGYRSIYILNKNGFYFTKKFCFFIFLYLIILNIKGDACLMSLCAPFYFCYYKESCYD